MSSMRYQFIGLAFLAAIINYLDRTALSYAIVPIQQTFHLTNTEFGALASAFGIGYVFMTVIGGILVDKFGARFVWTLFGVAWSLACVSISYATGFLWIFIARVILGAAEGPGFPALTRVTTDWLPAKARARALAFGLAAVPFASVIGSPCITFLITEFGWQNMFVILGFIGVCWSLIWFLVFRDKPAKKGAVKKINMPHWSVIVMLLKNKTLRVNNLGFFAFGYLLFFAITWLPGFLEQSFHVPIETVGWLLIVPWLAATISILIGGMISDSLWRRTESIIIARSRVIWVCQLLTVICLIPLLFATSLCTVELSISLAIGFGLMPNAPFYAIHADIAPEYAGTSLGIMTCMGAIAGIIAPFLTGWLTSLTGNFQAPIIVLIILTLASAVLIATCSKE